MPETLQTGETPGIVNVPIKTKLQNCSLPRVIKEYEMAIVAVGTSADQLLGPCAPFFGET